MLLVLSPGSHNTPNMLIYKKRASDMDNGKTVEDRALIP
jgi:hypothetical protein